MSSAALVKFQGAYLGADVLKSQVGKGSVATTDQNFVDQTFMKASIAFAVGCWEGYIEAVLREFVSKTRVQAHRNSWPLIAQFEAIVDKMAKDLNTPSWEKARELFLMITGMDPYASWVWKPKFSNQTDTKLFFEGIMIVRHAFAHGFSIPASVTGPSTPGKLDIPYVNDAISCIEFFTKTTDSLLEHELLHRHKCPSGWN